MKAPTQSRSEDSTHKMVDAALSVAAQDGLAAVTIARIAAESGCSNGALYHRFGNRDGLLVAASDQLLSEIEARMQLVLAEISRDLSDREALRVLVSENRRLFEERAGALRAFMIDGRSSAALSKRGYAASQMVGSNVVNWLTQRFGCTSRDADTAFRLLFASGALQIVIGDVSNLTQNRVSPEDAVNDLTDILLLRLG